MADMTNEDRVREIARVAERAHRNFMATGRDRASSERWLDIARAIASLPAQPQPDNRKEGEANLPAERNNEGPSGPDNDRPRHEAVSGAASAERDRALEEAAQWHDERAGSLSRAIDETWSEFGEDEAARTGYKLIALHQESAARIRAMKGGDGWKPTHRHLKSGGEYRHLGRARLQTDVKLGDMDVVEVYVAKDDTLWARRSAEFSDRFEPLPTPPGKEG